MKKKSIEEQIVEHLIKKYHPNAIILAGSRARGMESKTSDWDLFLLTGKVFEGGFYDFKGELLDVTAKKWPLISDGILTIPYAPLFPVKVLFDNTNGELSKVMGRTEKAFKKGPFKLYHTACKKRIEKLDRQLGKLKKYQGIPEVQYYYAGIFYEFAIRIWFEQKNQWPLPPGEALPLFKIQDNWYYQNLKKFSVSQGKESVKLGQKIVRRLVSLSV